MMGDNDLGLYLVIAMMAMAVSMAIIPLMIRLAPVLGMIDKPDPRKVHVVPIPRVGGIGIVIGAILPLFIWLPFNDLNISILIGTLILLVFGTWDDMKELGHYVKFVGQFGAASVVVYYGDLYVQSFPFMGLDLLSESVGRPFTVIAIVGMINAINHSDGLDGLAGGESLLSLAAISYLAYIYGGHEVLIIAVAATGGIFGFLRFNSHPARVFMGDGGSQFLGFILAVLVILLTQKVNPVISPALPLLLLGLPIMDILAVFFLRAKHKMNLFKATRNHIHHRLLEIGFYHYESVIIIYSVQLVFVLTAVFMPYEKDIVIINIYLITCAALFIMLTLAERKGWKIRHATGSPKFESLSRLISQNEKYCIIPSRILEGGLSLFVLSAALISVSIPADFAYSSVILFILLLLFMFTKWMGQALYRLVMFVTIGFAVYLLSANTPPWLLHQINLVYIFFAIMVISTFVAARLDVNQHFKITPLDYLVIVMGMAIGLVPELDHGSSSLVWMILQIIILFYACELIIQQMTTRFNRFSGSFALSLVLISLRGLL